MNSKDPGIYIRLIFIALILLSLLNQLCIFVYDLGKERYFSTYCEKICYENSGLTCQGAYVIGGRNGDQLRDFNGTIDEVYIYNRVNLAIVNNFNNRVDWNENKKFPCYCPIR